MLAPLASLALRLVTNGLDRANATQKQAGERWPEVSDEAPTLYAVRGGDATPQQALHMMDLIFRPPVTAGTAVNFETIGAARNDD